MAKRKRLFPPSSGPFQLLVKFVYSSGPNNFYPFQTAETPPPIGRGQNLVEKAVSVRYDRRRRRSSSCRVPHSCRSNRTRSDSYCKATQPSISELTVDEITKYAQTIFLMFAPGAAVLFVVSSKTFGKTESVNKAFLF